MIAGLAIIIAVLAATQYKWQTQASEAERERMLKRVEADTQRFAEDFNKEIQSAYFNFQTPVAALKTGDLRDLNERYAFWKGKAAFPELIREIYYIPADAAEEVRRYDAAAGTLTATEIPDDVRVLRERIEADANVRPVHEDLFALAVPLYNEDSRVERILIRQTKAPNGTEQAAPPVRMRPRDATLAVMLDERVIKEQLLPSLAAKYFGEGNYNIKVADTAGVPVFTFGGTADVPEASARLFDISPTNVIFFANRELMPKIAEAGGNTVVNQRIESHTITKSPADGGTGQRFEMELKNGGDVKTRTTVFSAAATDTAPWNLGVQHVSGSIGGFIDGERNRNLLIGAGVYLLLIGGIAAILISSARAKRFAQRQIDFVSSVSHEFRTPLAVIYSAGENLADGVTKDEEQVARYGNLIKGEGKRLSGMVEQILEFAGARSGRRKYNFKTVDPAEVIESAVSECGDLIEMNGSTVVKDIADGLPAINGDRDALVSSVGNLIANAVKYSSGRRNIRVSANNGGNSVRLSVEDDGIGIPKGELKHIFEPFYRGREAVDSQIHGSGLGLSIVKNVAEAHGGGVTAESVHGSGSKFTIEIPV